MLKRQKNKVLLIFGNASIEAYLYSETKSHYLNTLFLDENDCKDHLISLLNKYSKYKLTILLYSAQEEAEILTYPDIGKLNVNKKIKRKVGNKLHRKGIQDALLINKPCANNDHWRYYLLNYQHPEKFKETLLSILNHKIILDGIYLYSLEIIKTAQFLNDLIHTKEDKGRNIYYFPSKFGFIKKLIFNSQKLEKVQNIQCTSQTKAYEFLAKEKKDSDSKDNIFIIGSIKINKVQKSSCKTYLHNFSEQLLQESPPNKLYFDDQISQCILKLRSTPVKIPEVQEVSKYQNFCKFIFVPFVVLWAALFYFVSFNLLLKTNEKNIRTSLHRSLSDSSKSQSVLKSQLKNRERILKNNSKLRGIYEAIKNYNYPIEVLSVLYSSKNQTMNILGFSYDASNNSTINIEASFATPNKQSPLKDIKVFVAKLRKKLPNSKVTYHRKESYSQGDLNHVCMLIKIEDK
ncbi:MAG: hypothetical protein RLN62_01020 [Rickettsiales bacterium]